MQRIFALFLAFCMIFTLCACGKDVDTSKDTSSPSAETSPSTSTPTVTDPTESEPSASQPDPTNPDSTNLEPTDPKPTAPDSTESDPTDPPATTPQPTEPADTVDPAILGKYRLYCIDVGDDYRDYEALVASGMGNAYLLLNADGTAEMGFQGVVQSNKTWDYRTMTLTDGDGDTFSIVIDGEKLTTSNGAGINTYYKETSSIWDQMPTFYERLYDYIVANGEAQDGAWSYCYSASSTLTMTAAADGSIAWEYASSSFTVSLTLPETPQPTTATLLYKEYTGTATLLNAQGKISDFQHDGPGAFDSILETMLSTGISSMFMYVGNALADAGITASDLLP